MSSVLIARIGSGVDAGGECAGVGLKTLEGRSYEAAAGSCFQRTSKAGMLPTNFIQLTRSFSKYLPQSPRHVYLY